MNSYHLETNVQQQKSSKELIVLIYILCIKAAFKKVCNNDLDQFAKTVIAQKAMAVSGATPEQVKNFVEQCFAF